MSGFFNESMDPKIVSALVTIALFILLNLIIMPIKDKLQRNRSIRNEMLANFYGPLYYLILKHRKFLKATMDYDEHFIEEGVPPQVTPNPKIEGFEEIKPAVEDLISRNIHLLCYQDAKTWHNYKHSYEKLIKEDEKETANQEEILDFVVDYHNEFIIFLDEARMTYYKLYHNKYKINYLRQIHKKYKEKRKREKDQSIFNGNTEYKKKVKQLRKQEKEIKKRYRNKRI